MPSNSAEYMRAYRARKRDAEVNSIAAPATLDLVRQRESRIHELEAEVRHLKAELAKRSTELAVFKDAVAYMEGPEGLAEAESLADQVPMKHDPTADRFNTQPFTPVPKHRK